MKEFIPLNAVPDKTIRLAYQGTNYRDDQSLILIYTDCTYTKLRFNHGWDNGDGELITEQITLPDESTQTLDTLREYGVITREEEHQELLRRKSVSERSDTHSKEQRRKAYELLKKEFES